MNTVRQDLGVVGIGGSAGSFEALSVLLDRVGQHTGLAFVVVSHLPAGKASALPELLARRLGMPVHEISNRVALRANEVFVAPPGFDLRLESQRLYLVPSTARPIDAFFASLAEAKGELATAVILSGAGSDGSRGASSISAARGLVLVQDPSTARYGSMPRSASSRLTHWFLSPSKLADAIAGRSSDDASRGLDDGLGERWRLRDVLAQVRQSCGVDLSPYKPGFIRERLFARAGERQGLENYLEEVMSSRQEAGELLRSVLIGVTRFFRGGANYRALELELDRLVAESIGSLRVWVPGCSTGEEAYSIAILIAEALERQRRQLAVQIFATDLNAQAINVARTGRYAHDIAGAVSADRLRKFFTRSGADYQVIPALRRMVAFAEHNLLQDPSITRVDLISCRNLLIYLTPAGQERVVAGLHRALVPGGLLFLGEVEDVHEAAPIFETIDRDARLLRRRADVVGGHPLAWPAGVTPPRGERTELELARRARCGSAAVVIRDDGDVLYVHGRTGAFLELSEGLQERVNLLDMVRPELAPALRAALAAARSGGSAITMDSPGGSAGADDRDGSREAAAVTVSPLEEQGARGLWLVEFRHAEAVRAEVTAPASGRALEGGLFSPREDAVDSQTDSIGLVLR